MGVSKENNAHGTVPEYGAIFMSNSMTRTECFKRRIFGLPYWLGNFVQHIKSGMILFLFEYEKRVLHGVFRAISDGAMNIVPYAYSSSGKQFPAQVKFSIIWYCNPLSEDQFRNAIKENYFSAKKFNFGLSEEQVRTLLSLFSLTKINDQRHLRWLSSDSFECSSDYLIDESQSVADDDRLILNGRLQGKQMEGEDQVNTMQERLESVPPLHYNLRNIIPSTENPIPYSHMDDRNLTYNSGCHSNAQVMMPSLHSLSDCITCMPFQTSIYLDNITNPSVTQCQINVSCSDPNLLSLPTREFENDGSLRRSVYASQYPSHELNYSLLPEHNEQNIARQENTEAYYRYVPPTKEFSIQLPSDSVRVSSMPSNEHTTANYGHEFYGNSGSMHSGRERKGSVFSRLAYPSDESVQEFDDYVDHKKLFFDSSVDEVMSVLQPYNWQWEKTSHEVLSQEHKVGRTFIKKKQVKSSLSSYSNCFQVSDELRTNIEDNIDGNSNQIAIGTPFLDFKRRRKPCKAEDDTLTGGQNVNIGSGQLSGVQQKRRKLIRPSFACNELRDCGDTNSVSPDLQGSSKDSLFGERAGSDPLIETKKTEKLCQAAELLDIIWLVDDEDKDIGSGSVGKAEDYSGSTKDGSEDRKASSNYISDLITTSKVLGLNESSRCTHEGSTSEDHMASLNLNNSGLCSRQESSLAELNAGNSFRRVDEGGNKCNEKELVTSTKIFDEPFQGYATVTESTGKSSSPLDSASERVAEEFIERSKQNNDNEQWRPETEL